MQEKSKKMEKILIFFKEKILIEKNFIVNFDRFTRMLLWNDVA